MSVIPFRFTAAPPVSPHRVKMYAALLVFLVIGAYWLSLRAPLTPEEAVVVKGNPTICHLWPLEGPLSPPLDGGATTGRPVTNFSLAINYAISGEAPGSYHGLNLVIHIGAALALMGLVRRALKWDGLLIKFGLDAEPLAFAVAALWAVHPLQTESVAGIAQRAELLGGMFYLLTLYLFARGAGSPHSRTWHVLATVTCLLGMGAKETMATAPLVALLYDRTFLSGSFVAAWGRRRRAYLALGATWVLLLWLVVTAGGSRAGSAGFEIGISPWAYLLQQGGALVHYLGQAVWPHRAAVDHGGMVPLGMAELWWRDLVVVALLAITIWALIRHAAWGFLGAWFFMILAPSSSIVPLSVPMADHRMYVPLAALMALPIILGHRLARRAIGWIVVPIILLWFVLTVLRLRA